MSEHTYIKGKDRDLESSIASMMQTLVALDIHVEEASWLNPVANVYSVHIRDRDCGLMFTNGKGASAKACLASALGEYVERLSCNYFFADFYLGEHFAQHDFVHYPSERWFPVNGDEVPEGLLDAGLWDHYDPDGELRAFHLYDTNSGHFERGICALPYTRQRDGETLWFPVSLIGNLYVSNGMSAGNTQHEARVQGLSEVFERYVKNRILAEGICLPEVPDAVIDRYPRIRAAIDELTGHGFRLRVCDASLGGRFPVMNVTLVNPADGGVFTSFGAHPAFEVALERSLTELLQGRGLDQLDVFQPPTFDNAAVADHHNLETHFIDSSGLVSYDFFGDVPDHAFVDWDHDDSTGREFEYLCDIVHGLGRDVYIMDYEHLGVYACRILVPGMSEIYPVDELVWNNNNEGARLRETILSLQDLDAGAWRELLETLEAGGYSDFQGVAEFIGVAPDQGTAWAGLRIGELKAMLALALGEQEAALEWVEWCIQLGQLPAERAALYRAIEALLNLELDPEREADRYARGLNLIHGEPMMARARALVAGDARFDGLHSPGLGLAGFERHRRLLEGYAKLHRAKAAHWA